MFSKNNTIIDKYINREIKGKNKSVYFIHFLLTIQPRKEYNKSV